MEHHLLPKYAWPEAPSEVQVLCHCDPPYYHGKQGDFLTYPNTRDRAWLAFTDHSKYRYQTWNYLFKHPQPTLELEAFFQEWLFFGFLKEALGDDFNPASFTRTESGVRLIDTTLLHSTLEHAFHRLVQSSEHFETLNNHISNCLKVVLTLAGLSMQSSYVNPAFDRNILFSITSSAHRVISSLNHAHACRHGLPENFNVVFSAEMLRYPNDQTKERMIQAGWCPSRLHLLNRKFHSLQGLFALSRMNRRLLQEDHTGCTTDVSNCYQNSADACLPKHATDSCSCNPYDDQQLNADVFAILLKDNGAIPVLDIQGDNENLTINVVATTADTPYVAYSHVWADGLGNPNANALPRCQLCRLQALAQSLKTKSESNLGDSRHYIWVDTICCPCISVNRPESSKAKRIAINLMRQTYAKATCVLVLDAGLQRLNLNELTAWEALLWMFTSGWSSRLWCLQEGVLPANLYFQFCDQSVSSDTLKSRILKEMMQDSRVRDIAYDIADEYHWLDHKRSPSRLYSYFGDGVKDFMALIAGLQGRAVSIASDEALCIATMLDVSIQELQNEPEHVEDRMCKLWELVENKYQGLPIGLLMCEWPQLQRSGYRWAPKTLLKSRRTNWRAPFGNNKTGRLAKNSFQEQIEGVDTHAKFLGVSLRTAGFVIHRKQWSDGLQYNNPWHQLGPRLKSFACSTFQDTSTGQFYFFNNSDDVARQQAGELHAVTGYNQLDTGPCAIIQMTDLTADRNCQALIGKFTVLPDGRRLVTDTLLVVLAERTPIDNRILSAAQAIARDARQLSCVVTLDRLRAEGERLSVEDDQEAQAEGNPPMDQPEFQEAREALYESLLSDANNRLEEDAALREAVNEHLHAGNQGPAMYLGVTARDWFFNDYQATYYGSDTEWIID